MTINYPSISQKDQSFSVNGNKLFFNRYTIRQVDNVKTIFLCQKKFSHSCCKIGYSITKHLYPSAIQCLYDLLMVSFSFIVSSFLRAEIGCAILVWSIARLAVPDPPLCLTWSWWSMLDTYHWWISTIIALQTPRFDENSAKIQTENFVHYSFRFASLISINLSYGHRAWWPYRIPIY